MKKDVVIVGVIVAVIVGGISFYTGMRYGRNIFSGSLSASAGQNRFVQGGSTTGAMRNRQGNALGGFTSGEVISKDETSITLKVQTGGSKIIILGGSTQVMKSTEGSISDVKAGETVIVTGTPNSDGSITAQSIQIRPTRQTQATN